MKTINLVNLNTVSANELIEAAQRVCVMRETMRLENPLICGTKPNAKEVRFRKSPDSGNAYALIFETLKAACHLNIKAEV